MNKSTSYVLMLFAFALAIACSGKKDAADAAADSDEWPEMDEFHMVMAESFHPYKDSSNIEPAKANAAEMARVAEKWANAALPEKVNNDEIKANLAQLKTGTTAFIEIAQSGDTTKIGVALTDLHDQFHKLQEAWYAGGKEHHDKH